MADTVTLKRIIDLVTQSDIDSGVYTIIDSTTGAVKKYPIGSLICSIAPIFDATEDYSAGAYCNYTGQLYRFTADHAAGEWDGSDAEAVTVTDVMATAAELAGKADVDGTYEYLTAGLAEQILSDVVTVDKKPYLFRRTGADATREFDTLVGGSVVGNQLVEASGKDGSVAFDADTTSYFKPIKIINVPISAGHKYLYSAYISRTISGNNGIGITFSNTAPLEIANGAPDGVAQIIAEASTNRTNYEVTANNYTGKRGFNAGDSVSYDNLMIIDLTKMFGSTIADYAYTLEQATAGSGIAWLKSYGFFAGYQAYNAGSMVHVSGVSAHVMKDADDNIIGNYPLDDTLTLRGVLKLSNGEIYYDGDIYAHDGTVTRYYGIRAYQAGDESLTEAITDGTNTVYKLTTPTTETASPYQSPQICDPDGTEQYITDGIPVGHETQYPANLRGEIERVMVQVPKAPSANGTYTLKCTVSGGAASYAWTADS